MTSDDSTLGALEGLLDEFFAASTTNERKRNIENLLSSFGQQAGAWKMCFLFLEKSKNYYVHMYALSTIESLINLGWYGLPSSEREEIRKFLFEYLIAKHKQMPPYIKTKVLKAIADIGRNDWPHSYPDYLDTVLQLIKDSSTMALGISALQITSEEFIAPREDISMSRKTELRELLMNQTGTILHILTEILDGILLKYKRIVNTVTPPPSPNHSGSPYHSPATYSPITHHSPFASPRHSPHRSASPVTGNSLSQDSMLNLSPYLAATFAGRGENRQPMDTSSEEIVICSLNCLAHLFSWIPLSNLITTSLITKLFSFAEYGAVNSVNNCEENKAAEVGIQAMNAINEIMSKNFVPAEFESFLLKLFQQTIGLLYQITKSCSHSSGEGLLSKLNESYVEKFTEFLYLFVSIQMKRFEPNPNFHTADLLGLLLKYTFIQESFEGFYSCLDIWMAFLDYLIAKISNSIQPPQEKQAILNRYSSTLVDLLTYLIQKVQFKLNHNQLEELDDENMDDDSATEWDKLLNEVFEVTTKLLEIIPVEVFQKQKQLFEGNLELLFGMASHIVSDTGDWNRLAVTDESECKRMHYTLKDLSTSVRGLGAVSSIFIGEESFKDNFQNAVIVVERLTQVAMFCLFYKTYNIRVSIQTSLPKDFLDLQAQALASLKAYCHWLGQFCVLCTQDKGQKEKLTSTLVPLLEASIPLLMAPQVPKNVLIACVQLLSSITTTARPNFLLAFGGVQKLYAAVGNEQLNHLPTEVEVQLCTALSNALVLPWPNLSDTLQEWDMRLTNHKSLVSAISKDFTSETLLRTSTVNQHEQERRKSVILRVSNIVCNMIQTVSGEATQSKKIMFQSVIGCLQAALSAFPLYITHPDTADSILNLLYVGMQGLKLQMGLGFVQEIIQRLLHILTRDQMMKIVDESNYFGCKVVEKFLKILELVVQEPNISFKKLTPSVINFGLDHILPVLNKSMSSELKGELFELFHQLLLHNWRYFYKSDVLSKMAGADTLENEQQFIGIIKEFGRALMENDIGVFRKSLAILEDLNEKYKLYQKIIFRGNMMPTFLQVLLQVLVHRSHYLLEEEITLSAYNMVSVDFEFFYSTFMPQYLLQSEGLSDQQRTELLQNLKVERDLPSFSTSIQRFASDLRYYRIVNRSLPHGSVQL